MGTIQTSVGVHQTLEEIETEMLKWVIAEEYEPEVERRRDIKINGKKIGCIYKLDGWYTGQMQVKNTMIFTKDCKTLAECAQEVPKRYRKEIAKIRQTLVKNL